MTANPHSQVLGVAVQLGIAGAGLLIAMWLAHLTLFRAATPMAWIGFVVVAQNVLGSLFNSHISDFTQGWLYVIGVGVLGAARASAAPEGGRYGMSGDAPEAEKANLMKGLPERARILVITLRRLGDVLLTTPLIRTVRRGFPDASLDVLVFRGGERILAGNPDINDVVVMSERPSAAETWALIRRLWRRYDFVISTQSGDRPAFFALVAGRRRVGLVPPAGETGAGWKRLAYHVAITPAADSHRMTHLQQLADALRLPFVPEIVCPQGAQAAFPACTAFPACAAPTRCCMPIRPTATSAGPTAAGRCLARALADRGLTVAVTGGPDAAERAYLDALWDHADPAVVRLDGKLDWPQLAALWPAPPSMWAWTHR